MKAYDNQVVSSYEVRNYRCELFFVKVNFFCFRSAWLYFRRKLMKYKYYLDESGNTGDLINKQRDLTFAAQPLFSLAAIGVETPENLADFVTMLIKKYNVQQNELKCASLYKTKPTLILDVCKYITNNNLPFFLEVVDKKYCICTAIVNHLILPPYYSGDESDGNDQYFRNLVADYLACNMPNDCYINFFESCENASEDKLKLAMDALKRFALSKDCQVEYRCISKAVDESWDDYMHMKKTLGEEAITRFIPIPDINKKDNKVHLLPHVSCLTNIIARANLFHRRNLKDVTFIHDKQDHFDEILSDIKEQLIALEITDKAPSTPSSDYNFEANPELTFENTVKSNKSPGIQIADLLAGFISRYFNECIYLKSNMDEIYNDIFMELRSAFDAKTGVGINMVLPESKRKEFENFLIDLESKARLK